MSKPIVVIACMLSSSESWEPQTEPTSLALTCRCRSRPQHQETTYAVQQILVLGLDITAPRQAHCKHRTFAQLARHDHIAAHHARELARDCKAEASAAKTLRGGRFGLRKFCEQLRLLLRRPADARFRDRDLDPVASIDEPSRLELDLTFLGELAGIAQ